MLQRFVEFILCYNAKPLCFSSLHLHLQDTSKRQCVEDFLEGMLGKQKFE